MWNIAKAARVGALLACVGASSCFDCEVSYSDREAVDDRGPKIADDAYGWGYGTSLAFSSDGTEVFYTAAPGSGWASLLRAVRVADGVQRTVRDTRILGPLLPTADGTALYLIEWVPPVGDGRATVRLMDAFSGANPLLEAGADMTTLVALSPAGRRLVGDSTAGGRPVVVDLDTTATTATPCDHGPATFSPGSDALLCAGWYGEVKALALEGPALPVLHTFADAGQLAALSWTEARILAAFGRYDEGPVIVGEPASGEVVARFTAGEHTTVPGPMAFTLDGTALVFVEDQCLESTSLWVCSARGELRIRLLDLESGVSRTIASAGWRGGSGAPGVALALSPDGKTIAYTFDSDLHVRPTGR